MISHNVPGNLETLCLPAAHAKWGMQNEVDALVNAAPANTWPLTKQSKMRLQTMLAATCLKAPNTSFAHLWGYDAQYHLPLAHQTFDEMADFLRDFGAMLPEAT